MTLRLDYWGALDELVAGSRVIIDRPRGSRHPRYPDFTYPLDYGYLEGTTSGDRQGIDVWVGSRDDRSVTGVVMAVDLEKRDAELKVLLGCTPDEMRLVHSVHQDERCGAILVERAPGDPLSREGEG
ncbi:MAG TPA: inorganic pyrophosphatase [Deinococcales bacterium]|nr:inorganic pyrophosphatase [Deinococcales bacterium]